MSWYWHEIGDKYTAQYATTSAVWIAYLAAMMTGLIGILSLAYHKPTSWYWNEIGDKYSAQYATTTAVWISYLIALATGLIGIVSLAYRKPILGLDGWAVLAAGLFAVMGWRIGRLSRAWSVVGFSIYVLGVLVDIGAHLAAGTFGFLPTMEILFVVVYLNALRGTFAYHTYVKLEAAQPNQQLSSE
jgi:hypothetical protein